MRKSTRGLTLFFLLGVSSLVFPSKGFSELEKILDQTFQVSMFPEKGISNQKPKPTKEDVRIVADFDDEKKELYVSFYTQNFDKTDWTNTERRSPAWERYTSITDGNTRFYVMLPSNVKVSDRIIEEANTVNVTIQRDEHELIRLTPLEQHPYLEVIFDSADKLIKKLAKLTKVKYLDKILGVFIKDIKERENRTEKEALEEANAPNSYSATAIPYFPTPYKLIETARHYRIPLETSSKKEIPVYVWIKLGLGDPSSSSTGTMNKSGELEGIVFNFTMNKKATAKTLEQTTQTETSAVALKDITEYFPKENEVEKLELTPIKIEALGYGVNNRLKISNPYFFQPSQIANVDGLNAKGIASYSVLNKEGISDEIGFYMEVFQFINKNKIPEYLKTRAYQYSDLGYFCLVADNVLVTIDSFMNYQSGKVATKEQASRYLDFLTTYAKRIGVKEIIMNKLDQKGLKKDFEKNPGALKDRITNPGSYGFGNVNEAIRYLFSPINY